MTTRQGRPTIQSSAPTSSRKRSVRHVYDRASGDVAQLLGVQVRMVCGVWGWPRRVPNDVNMTSSDMTVRHCKRCARVLAAVEGGRR